MIPLRAVNTTTLLCDLGHTSTTANFRWNCDKSRQAKDWNTLWRIKNCTLLTGTITLQNYAILWWFLAYRCTREYPIACLFDSLCRIENWEPAYQICHCLLSRRQQRKMLDSCCNARQQTSSLQTYGLTFLTSILWLQDMWSNAVTGLSEIC